MPLAAILLCSVSFTVSAGEMPPSPEWDTALDGIYTHTWRGRVDLAVELARVETRAKQDLAGYLAAWEQRLAAPIVYTAPVRTGEGCGPLTYCAADFLDPQQIIAKLRENKEPLAHFLLEKLSPEARNIIVGNDAPEGASDKSPAGSGSAGTAKTGSTPAKMRADRVNQILADELTRIVREETLYDKKRFAGIQLSPAAIALATEYNTPQYRVCTNKTLLVEAYPEALARNFKCVIQKDETNRRVVAAKTVQYLITGERKPLDEAISLSDSFANKLMYTDFAFWYYYPRALADILSKDPAALNRDAYALLNNVVLWRESLDSGSPAPADMEQRHYAWNLADLILTRGIVNGKMKDLEPLGSAVWLLGDLNETEATSEQEQKLLRLVVDVKKYLTGPESDNFRLNYAAAMNEGRNRAVQLNRMLNEKKKGPEVEKLFNEAREYLLLAYDWAGTGQGKATAVTSYLELANTALARMKDILPQATFASLTGTPGKVNAEMAAAVFRTMADKENTGWNQLRFIDRKSYNSSSQHLWNALGRNSILVADYWLNKMDRNDFQSVMDNAEPAEKVLLGYVNLFETYAAHGPREIIPDAAYFTYAQAFKKLSQIKRIVYSYNKNMDLHNQSINYLLKAIAVYPYDDGLSEYAANSKNINTGVINTLPDRVVSKVVANSIVSRCLRSSGNYCDREMKQTLEWNIYKVANNLYTRRDADRTDELKSMIRKWKEDQRSQGNTGPRLESQRSSLITLAERFTGSAGRVTTLTSGARQQFAACSADGTPCKELSATQDHLLSGKADLEKVRNELIAACDKFKQQLGAAPVGRDLDFVTNLAAIVNDIYVYQTDQVIDIGLQKKLYELRTMDNHPMHKLVKAGYLAK
jgi:hypothetical protein